MKNKKKFLLLIVVFVCVSCLSSCTQEIYQNTPNNTSKNTIAPKATSEPETENIQSQTNNEQIKKNPDDYIGIYSVYCLTDEKGNVLYDSKEFFENFDFIQDYPGFFLLENGKAASNSGGESYYYGDWTLLNNSIKINSFKYQIDGNYLIIDADIDEYIPFAYDTSKLESINTLYIHYIREPLEDWCYPPQ